MLQVKSIHKSMNSNAFWKIIDLLDWNQDKIEDVLKPAIQELSTLSIEDIYEFQEILSEKLYHLDTQKHAENIGTSKYQENSRFSPDIFLYARASVVAEGKDFYEKVLCDPTLMPKDIDFEPLLYLAADAYKLKTNQEWSYVPEKYIYETFFNKEGWNLKENPIEQTIQISKVSQ